MPVTINALDLITDPDEPLDAAKIAIIEQPANGEAHVDIKSGTIVYSPQAGFAGADQFAYRGCDSFGACATGHVSIDVTRLPLIAESFTVSTSPRTPIKIEVLQHVSDPDGTLDPATVKANSEGLHGKLAVDPQTGAITYTPQRGFLGDDRFGYQVCDTQGGCARAVVTINVRVLADDVFAYCAAVGDVDAPDARYAGPAVPDAIAISLSKQLEIPGARLPAKLIQWRCMGGQVFACSLGANLPCGKANTSRAPTPEMAKYCADILDAEEIPAAVTGHDTIYTWRCTKGVPDIISQVFKVDQRGFVADFWHLIPPG
jgi:hypothetical protein